MQKVRYRHLVWVFYSIMFVLTACGSPATTPSTTQRTMVENLAIIEGVADDAAKVAHIEELLKELDEKYPESEQQIGDMTAGAYGEIEKRGQSVSIIEIMEAMIEVAEAGSGITYADAVTAYALIRVNGQ